MALLDGDEETPLMSQVMFNETCYVHPLIPKN
jgi:hypothetical protein